ncbi:MAG TPA: ice-binding family protein [Paludibacter sp.]|nr:ice-binding family protein [Paludibacter sp.]
MKKNLLNFVTAVALLFIPSESGFAKINPSLASAAKFVLFTSNGALNNVGLSNLDGFIGSNGGGGSTNFAITTGVHEIHDGDATSIQAANDLSVVYNQLTAAPQTGVLLPALGAGQELNPGVYALGTASSLIGELILNGQGDSRAEFIFKIGGAFSTAALSEIVLINGANPCNIYWVVEGAVTMATQTKMKGTMIANNAAFYVYSGVNLEGRLLSTNGAINVDSLIAFVPDCSYILTSAISKETSSVAEFSPNPMNGSVLVTIPDASAANPSQLKIYNALGKMVVVKTIKDARTTVETNLPSGIYFYKIAGKNNKIQTGKLISK